MQGRKMRDQWGTNEGPDRLKTDRHDWKMRDQISSVGKCGTGKCKSKKCKSGKYKTKNAGIENEGPEMCTTNFNSWNGLEKTQKCTVNRCITSILSYAAVKFFVVPVVTFAFNYWSWSSSRYMWHCIAVVSQRKIKKN